MNKYEFTKSSKHTKMPHFETFLFPSKRVQIKFWVAEKIAIEQMNPNPKNGQNAQCQFFYIQKSREKVVFLAVLKKVKKWIFCDILWRIAFMSLKICWKKTYDRYLPSPIFFFEIDPKFKKKYRDFRLPHFFFPPHGIISESMRSKLSFSVSDVFRGASIRST